MVNNWLNIILSKTGRPCLVCGQHGNHNGICLPCRDDLPANVQSCSRCANPLSEANHSGLCGRCIKKLPAFDRVVSPYLYREPLRQAVTAFKFHSDLTQGRMLAQLLEQHLQQNLQQRPQCLIPVPLHASRLRQRGFNQSQELARYLQQQLNIPMDSHSCLRTRKTLPQSELPEKHRHKNIRDAFRVELKQRYKHVAIIDDVMTTGTTVNELARELKKAGVETVQVWSVCRAINT